MAFEKIKTAYLRKELELEERNRKKRIEQIKKDYKKEQELIKKQKELTKLEYELREKINKARTKGLSKVEREYLYKKEQALTRKREELREKSKQLAGVVGNVFLAFGRGFVKNSIDYGRATRNRPKR